MRKSPLSHKKHPSPIYGFHETCHSVTFIVLVNSHQRGKQTRNHVCFHLWCELTMALRCRIIAWSLFLEMKYNGITNFMEFMLWWSNRFAEGYSDTKGNKLVLLWSWYAAHWPDEIIHLHQEELIWRTSFDKRGLHTDLHWFTSPDRSSLADLTHLLPKIGCFDLILSCIFSIDFQVKFLLLNCS